MKPRITTSDIARAAGLHQTTVSLALRNDKRLRPETIARIKAVAAKLGYAPDPMLSAPDSVSSVELAWGRFSCVTIGLIG